MQIFEEESGDNVDWGLSQTLETEAPAETRNKLENLKQRDCIVGDPEDLVHLEWPAGLTP